MKTGDRIIITCPDPDTSHVIGDKGTLGEPVTDELWLVNFDCGAYYPVYRHEFELETTVSDKARIAELEAQVVEYKRLYKESERQLRNASDELAHAKIMLSADEVVNAKYRAQIIELQAHIDNLKALVSEQAHEIVTARILAVRAESLNTKESE